MVVESEHLSERGCFNNFARLPGSATLVQFSLVEPVDRRDEGGVSQLNPT